MTWAEERRVRVPGGELAVVDAGDAAAPSVVLLHGDLTSSFLWRRLVPMLAPWMRVLAPDLPGHGGSDAFGEASPAGRAEIVRELLDALGVDRFAAVGHAAGGAVAQLLALGGRVEAMVLIDAFAPGARPAPLPDRPDADPADDVRRLLELGMSHRERLTDADLEGYLEPFAGERGSRALPDLTSSVAGLEELEPRLAGLEIPVFVLWGEDDRIVDASVAERLGETLPWASVALLPGCGHLLLEDAPETVAPLVFQWLRSRYLKVEHRHETGPVTVDLGRRPPGEGG